MGAGSGAIQSHQPDQPDAIRALFPVTPGDALGCDNLRGQGNAAFSGQRYTEAIELYTKCIAVAGTDARLFSNRSAAHASLGEQGLALGDACTAVVLAPTWSKAYYRQGAALLQLDQ